MIRRIDGEKSILGTELVQPNWSLRVPKTARRFLPPFTDSKTYAVKAARRPGLGCSGKPAVFCPVFTSTEAFAVFRSTGTPANQPVLFDVYLFFDLILLLLHYSSCHTLPSN
jgi:hypothetical protein